MTDTDGDWLEVDSSTALMIAAGLRRFGPKRFKDHADMLRSAYDAFGKERGEVRVPTDDQTRAVYAGVLRMKSMFEKENDRMNNAREYDRMADEVAPEQPFEGIPGNAH